MGHFYRCFEIQDLICFAVLRLRRRRRTCPIADAVASQGIESWTQWWGGWPRRPCTGVVLGSVHACCVSAVLHLAAAITPRGEQPGHAGATFAGHGSHPCAECSCHSVLPHGLRSAGRFAFQHLKSCFTTCTFLQCHLVS